MNTVTLDLPLLQQLDEKYKRLYFFDTDLEGEVTDEHMSVIRDFPESVKAMRGKNGPQTRHSFMGHLVALRLILGMVEGEQGLGAFQELLGEGINFQHLKRSPKTLKISQQ
jgi:hypothetical protein